MDSEEDLWLDFMLETLLNILCYTLQLKWNEVGSPINVYVSMYTYQCIRINVPMSLCTYRLVEIKVEGLHLQ